MDLKAKMLKFNQRWNITWEVTSYQEEIKGFKIRVKNTFSDHIDAILTKESKMLFCQYFGISSTFGYDLDWYFRDLKEEVEIYRFLEVMFSLEFKVGWWTWKGGENLTAEEVKWVYFWKLAEALSYSKLNVNIVKQEDEIIFYPKGEELLDKEIVNNVLSFLSWSSREHFQVALSFHLAKNWIKVGESIRRALEEFLKEKLSNTKWLKANILEVSKILKTWESPSQTRNIINQNFSYLDDYFNNHTKHNDGDLDESDAEFLIYQAGLLMRYISKTIK